MKKLISLKGNDILDLSQVGGKGYSLIEMTRLGLPVPPGVVLTAAFFQPWIEAVQRLPQWTAIMGTNGHFDKAHIENIKTAAMQLEFDDGQRAALDQVLALFESDGELPLLAVRSSSPEEDLEGASFAGGYETTLGVNELSLEEAIRHSFASGLDERVLIYKKEHGFAIDRPRIAVVIQEQIAAEVSGVAFSLNPLNNCFDEAIINANYGLGESVVSGQVSPDTYVMDKVKKSIIEQQLGAKETSIWLDNAGGTFPRQSDLADSFCLDGNQLADLLELIIQVESLFGKPVDIEWALADNQFYLLQSRPITAYFPLPPAFRTEPGEPKYLYADLTQAKWGMHEPLTVMGTDYLKMLNLKALRLIFGDSMDANVAQAIRPTYDGRTYINLSNSIKLQGKKRVIAQFQEMDTSAAAIIEELDESEYLPDKLPPYLRGLMRQAVANNLGAGWQILKAIRQPQEIKHRFQAAEKEIWELYQNTPTDLVALSFVDYADRITDSLMHYMRLFTPVFAAALYARYRMKRLFKNAPELIQAQLPYLEQSLPNNVTISMGLAMVDLAAFAEIVEIDSADEFVHRLKSRDLSAEFLVAWDEFMKKYGFRCPMEMDVGACRFYEQPAKFFKQLQTLAGFKDENNPRQVFEAARARRKRAFAVLYEYLSENSRRKAQRFARYYENWVDLGGYRESPKYFLIIITDLLRRRILDHAEQLVDEERLDDFQQVFDLHLQQLDEAQTNKTCDLRQMGIVNSRYVALLKASPYLPHVVDSRGKILRPKIMVTGEGHLIGQPISPGTAVGPVKILHEPDEKPVLPGEILVTRATDPGWTPLFLNAAGVILEVGGMLQHGALVAREYGKPCVAGVVEATEQLRDGQLVELLGVEGVVKLLHEN